MEFLHYCYFYVKSLTTRHDTGETHYLKLCENVFFTISRLSLTGDLVTVWQPLSVEFVPYSRDTWRSLPDRNNGRLLSNGWNGEQHKRHIGAL